MSTPSEALANASAGDELDTARDIAAVLDWRLDDTGHRSTGQGPLPWLPAIPATLREDPQWGAYLTARSDLVAATAAQVRTRVLTEVTSSGMRPSWHRPGMATDATTLADVEVWRAAMKVDPGDRRPTGPAVMQKAAHTWRAQLRQRVDGDFGPAVQEWQQLLLDVMPAAGPDEFLPALAERLAAVSRAGIDAASLTRNAAALSPLPDDHAAAALWWRISRQLSPAVGAQVDTDLTLTTHWTPRLPEILGPRVAARVQSSPAWPALVTTIEQGLHRGWRLEDLLTLPADSDRSLAGSDECEALVWRTSLVLQPIPDPEDDEPPAAYVEPVGPGPITPETEPAYDARVEADLALAALTRDLAIAPELTDADVSRMLARARAWDHAPVSRDRMLQINEMACAYFESRVPGSWSRGYLIERFGQELSGNGDFRPGYAPVGWTNLVTHLHRRGVTDDELLACGLATRASTGRLIDRFRDRLVFPILHPVTLEESTRVDVLGFIARRNPDLPEADLERAGPKYLNTAENPLFHKGDQLYGVLPHHLKTGSIPVLVEGPTDAVAVTLATGGVYVGVASLGTAFTHDQAHQLRDLADAAGRQPIVATDPDPAGRLAAERDFWILASHGLDPQFARLPSGVDPADLHLLRGPHGLAGALQRAVPLGQVLISERLEHLPSDQAMPEALQVLAAMPPGVWDPGAALISTRTGVPISDVRRRLVAQVRTWSADPRGTADEALSGLARVRDRLGQDSERPGEETEPTTTPSPSADSVPYLREPHQSGDQRRARPTPQR